MKMEVLLRWFKLVLVLSFAYGFTFAAVAQNYYPAEVGNIWVLERSDGAERRTYSLEDPETVDGIELITLKIKIEDLNTGDVYTDEYFLSVGSEAIKLHRTVLQDATVGAVTADFPTPATFFPLSLMLGDKWQIEADAKLKIGPLPIDGKSTTNLEVVGFDDLETPAGTFQNCAKVELALTFSAGGFVNIDATTYQWLAPDIGPVQYENSEGLLFRLTSTNVSIAPEPSDTTEEEETPDTEEEVVSEPSPGEDPMPELSPYDVTGDGVVNILDLSFVAARFGEMDSEADVTGDGIVNILDLVRIAQNFDS